MCFCSCALALHNLLFYSIKGKERLLKSTELLLFTELLIIHDPRFQSSVGLAIKLFFFQFDINLTELGIMPRTCWDTLYKGHKGYHSETLNTDCYQYSQKPLHFKDLIGWYMSPQSEKERRKLISHSQRGKTKNKKNTTTSWLALTGGDNSTNPSSVQKIRPAINGLSHRTRHQMFDIGGFIQYPFHLFFKGKVRHLNEKFMLC